MVHSLWARRTGRLVVLCAIVVVVSVSIVRFTITGATVDPHRLQQATNQAMAFATRRTGLPPTKAAIINAQGTRYAEHYLTPESSAPPGTPFVKSVGTPETIAFHGIGVSRENPYDHGQYVQNEWYGEISGVGFEIYAGSSKLDQTQGVVGVAMGTTGQSPDSYKEYLTPSKHGTLKITAVNGSVVSLVAKDGTMLTFDLSTFTFKE